MRNKFYTLLTIALLSAGLHVSAIRMQAQTVYFINAAQWTDIVVAVQVWENESWVVLVRSDAMTKTTEQVNGFDIYSYALPDGYSNYSLAFDDSQSSERSHTTASNVLPEGSPYFCVNGLFDSGTGWAQGEWYASLDAYMEAAANAQFKHLHIDNLYYNLNPDNQTAEVTYDVFESEHNYSGLAGTVIPSTVEYESVTYTVTGIGEKAFAYCSGLSNIRIPNDVTYLDNEAFTYCTSLNHITCEATTPPYCGTNVFGGVDLSSLELYVPGASIEAYTATEDWKGFTNIQAIEGTGQQEIIASGYCGAEGDGTNLSWVLTGDSVLTISGSGEMANWNEDEMPWYENKEQILKIRLEEGILSIGDNAFYNFRTITSVEFPNSLTSIGSSAFLYDRNLLSLTIPQNVTRIGAKAFSGCSSLKMMTCKAVSPPSIARSSLTDDKKTFVIFVPAESVEAYKAANFWNEHRNILATYGSEPTIIDLGYCGAEEDSTNITWVLTGDSVLTISGSGEMANFSPAGSPWVSYTHIIKSVVIGNGITSIGGYAFDACTHLTSVIIPNSITSIEQYACSRCSSMTNIDFSNNVTSIGDYAFADCSSLTKLVITSNITNIGASVFSGCSSLTSIEVENGNTTYDSRYNCNAIIETGTNTLIVGCKNTIIPNSVVSIGCYAFYECSGLLEISISDSITGIGCYAFYGCSGLTSLTLPNNIPGISSYAFYRCSGLTKIVIPNSVTYIEAGAFQYCTKLTSVTIPDEVTSIDSYAFDNCRELKSVIIPNSVLTIAENAFSWCTSLTEVTIGNSVTYIGNEAFYKCYELAKVTIPNSVTDIGKHAFAGSEKLASITCEAVTPPTCTGTVSSRTNDVILYVPKESIEAYQTAEYWKDFSNIQAIPEEETVVTVFGITITPEDSTSTEPVDLLGDSTLVYNPEDNTLTFSGVDWNVGEDETAAISYTGTEPLVIVLNETSTIYADTVISSTADVVITGDGELIAEGTVPIIGVPTATITFDSVTMYVHSTSGAQALRRRIRGEKRLDETGGPALSGFGSADFNKTNVSPSGALYGAVNIPDGNGGTTAINALYILNDDGEQKVLTEFYLTAVEGTGVEDIREYRALDPAQPMYNILGLQVDASYRGIVIQNGRSYVIIDN